MANGYTYKIIDPEDGEKFTPKDYIIGCAAQFATRTDRNDETKHKDSIKFYEDCLEKSRIALADTEAKTKKQWIEEMKQANEVIKEGYKISLEKSKKYSDLYDEYFKAVQTWEPPTPQHENLKIFALAQIAESKDHDVHAVTEPTLYDVEDPKQVSEYKNAKLTSIEEYISRLEFRIKEEEQRYKEHIKWNEDLIKSLEDM